MKADTVTRKLSLLACWQLFYWSKPAGDRSLFKHIASTHPTSLVEVGLSGIERSRNLILLAQRYSPASTIRYCGIDLFEGRANRVRGLSLKDTHRELSKTGARVRLIPGDLVETLPRIANQLSGNDLLVISTDASSDAIASTWLYVPRMLNKSGAVMLRASCPDEVAYQRLVLTEVERLAERRAAGLGRAA